MKIHFLSNSTNKSLLKVTIATLVSLKLRMKHLSNFKVQFYEIKNLE